ncbi:MAG: DUF3196 family protein [Erysipelotrichaceae bacterium]|nr:DUF3196 family protein [Erysipelotrichaceae bacterium]
MEDNYYSQLLNDIALCMKQGNYQRAKELVDAELKMPYVPGEVLKHLQQYREQLDVLLRKEKPLTVIEPEELEGMLKGNYQQANNALRSLRSANARNYLEQIRKCLTDSDIHHVIRAMVLEVLVEQNVDEQLDFERDGKMITVIPAQLPKVSGQPVLNELMEALDKLLNKNPSFLQQAQILALNLAYDLFPELLEHEMVSAYTYSIIRYLYRCYGENEQWKQFAESQGVDETALMELSF